MTTEKREFRSLVFTLMMCVHIFCHGQQDNTVGTIALNSGIAQPGLTLIYPHNQSHAMLINLCGDVVHEWSNDESRRPGNMAYLQPNGDLLWAHRNMNNSEDAIWAGGGGATIERRTWENEFIWSYSLNDSTGRLHHDFIPLGNGNVIAIAWERIDSLDCIAAGRLPENLSGNGLWSERLIELEPNASGGADIIWEWRVWDHLIQDYEPSLDNYGPISDHPHRVDINYGTTGSVEEDWLHINSIDFQPSLGHILLSVPTFDELWIIDRNEAEAGLKWRWGNPEAYGVGASETQQLHYQHSAYWLDSPELQSSSAFGKIAVFNNRNPGSTGPYSSAHILAPQWDEMTLSYLNSESTYAPETFDWSWTAPTPTDFFSSGLSNFQRLPNGNNLILSGRTGEIFEFTASGDTAWQYRVPLQSGVPISQGTSMGVNDNLLFRAKRYSSTYPAFESQFNVLNDLGEALELNPIPVEACQPCSLTAEIIQTAAGLSLNIQNPIGVWSVVWSDQEGSILCEEPSLEWDGDCPTMDLINGQVVIATITDQNSCQVVVEGNWITSAIPHESVAFSFYPNPATNHITVKGILPNQNLRLLDCSGRLVSVAPYFGDQQQLEWDLPELGEGLYFIQGEKEHYSIVISPR